MALYVFSDAHLGGASLDKEQEKLKKLALLFSKVSADGDRVVILGDLFDFWFEYKYVIPKAHHEVLFALRELVKQGIQVDYVSGNHDFWMGDFFQNHLGIPVHPDQFELEYGRQKFLLVHGDGLAKGDRGYRVLKRILRNPVNVWLYRKLPPDWAFPLARFVSGSSRDYTSRRDHEFADDYAAFARSRLGGAYDVVVIGHLHIPIFAEYPEGLYVNTGDFIHHYTYLKCDSSGKRLESLK